MPKQSMEFTPICLTFAAEFKKVQPFAISQVQKLKKPSTCKQVNK
jgi:hypothetical protein